MQLTHEHKELYRTAKRFVQENLADVERALAAQACDAGR